MRNDKDRRRSENCYIVNNDYMNKLGGCNHTIYNMTTCKFTPIQKNLNFQYDKRYVNTYFFGLPKYIK